MRIKLLILSLGLRAEQKLRNDSVGRKNYYGSGTSKSGYFTVTLFSIFQTLLLWKINPRPWLTEYLQTCANYGGQPPSDISLFMPWNMSDDQLKRYRSPPTYYDVNR